MAQPIIGLVAPQIPAPFWILAKRSTFNEPGMMVRGVIRHEIEDHSKTAEMNLCQQAVEILHRSKDRIDAAIIQHIVAKIGHGRRVDRRDPDGVNPKPHKVIKPLKNPFQIANPIAVAVLKRARINLIDNAVLPPGGLLHLNKCSCSSNFPLKVSSYDQRSLVQEPIIYSLSVATYMDANGVGDFQGLLRRLDYLHASSAAYGSSLIWL